MYNFILGLNLLNLIIYLNKKNYYLFPLKKEHPKFHLFIYIGLNLIRSDYLCLT